MFVYRQRASLCWCSIASAPALAPPASSNARFIAARLARIVGSASTCSTVCRSSSTVPASRSNSTRTPIGGTGRSPPTSRPGQVQFLDARHRTQAHVEDKMKEVKACGAGRLPSNDYARNSAWLQIAALAVSLLAWLRHIGLEGDPRQSRTQDAALPDLLRSRPPRHPRPQEDPENPTRLDLVHRPGHRLATHPRPAAGLNPPHPSPRQHSPGRPGKNRRPPEHLGHHPMPSNDRIGHRSIDHRRS